MGLVVSAGLSALLSSFLFAAIHPQGLLFAPVLMGLPVTLKYSAPVCDVEVILSTSPTLTKQNTSTPDYFMARRTQHHFSLRYLTSHTGTDSFKVTGLFFKNLGGTIGTPII